MVQKNNEINKKKPIKLQYEEIVTKLNALTHKMRQRGCDKCISIYKWPVHKILYECDWWKMVLSPSMERVLHCKNW